ncbi:hypothetical protein BKA93DRAFT_826243 [Sparassis latifolia]
MQLILNAMKDVAKDYLNSIHTRPWQPKQDQSETKPITLGTEMAHMFSSLNHHTQAVAKAELLPWMMSMVLVSHTKQGHVKMVTPVLMNASKALVNNSDTRKENLEVETGVTLVKQIEDTAAHLAKLKELKQRTEKEKGAEAPPADSSKEENQQVDVRTSAPPKQLVEVNDTESEPEELELVIPTPLPEIKKQGSSVTAQPTTPLKSGRERAANAPDKPAKRSRKRNGAIMIGES